jgi:hypothetical protein
MTSMNQRKRAIWMKGSVGQLRGTEPACANAIKALGPNVEFLMEQR